MSCRGSAPGRIALSVLLLGCALSGSACITVYQPLTGLQRPIAVDPQLANFEGLRLRLSCAKNDFVSKSQADTLCRKVTTLFANQGASVETEDDLPLLEEGEAAPPGPAYDLYVELTARQLHEEGNTLNWVLCFATGTIVPAVSEYTFAQDITVRDAEGAVLASDTLTARFVRYFGGGIWWVNTMLDWFVREDEDELSDEALERDFSKDFYGQLSQLVFNARIRHAVLQDAAAPRAQ